MRYPGAYLEYGKILELTAVELRINRSYSSSPGTAKIDHSLHAPKIVATRQLTSSWSLMQAPPRDLRAPSLEASWARRLRAPQKVRVPVSFPNHSVSQKGSWVKSRGQLPFDARRCNQHRNTCITLDPDLRFNQLRLIWLRLSSTDEGLCTFELAGVFRSRISIKRSIHGR